MSDFSAQVEQMQDVAVRLQNLSRRIDSVTASLRSLSGQIDHNKSLGKLGYADMVREVSNVTELQSKNVAQCTRVLEETASLYAAYENRVIRAPFDSDTTHGSGASESRSNPFWNFLRGDAKLAGAIFGGAIAGEGEFLGIGASGAISGELFGGELSLKPEVGFKLGDKDSDAEAYARVKGSAEGWVAKGKAEGDYGLLHGEAEVKVGTGSVEGELGASLFENGKFAPSLAAGASAKASALSGSADARFGDENTNLHAGAKGDLFVAEAEARARVGTDGFGASVEAGAWAAQGEVSGGIELLGVKIDLGLKGKAGGVGAEAQFGADKNSVEGELGLGLGLGAGVSLKVDYSGAAKAIDDWWNGLWK